MSCHYRASSLLYDRAEKIPRYAHAGIRETWLVDVPAREVTIYSDPRSTGYAATRVLPRGSRIISPTVPELDLPSTELFARG